MIEALIGYGICQSFFLAVIMLLQRKPSLFKKLFATLLIIEGCILLERLLVETEAINTFPHLLGIAFCISFLKPPLLYLMALSIVQSTFTLTRKMCWHTMPFVLILLLNIPFFLLPSDQKLSMISAYMEEIPSFSSISFYFGLAMFIYIGIYIYMSIRQLRRFRVHVINHELVNWYYIILIAYVFFLGVHLIYFISQPIGQFNFGAVNHISMLAMTFIIQAIAYKLIDGSKLFNAKTPNLEDLERRVTDTESIILALEKDKIYLEDELTLESFAQYVSLAPNYTSELINQKFGYSFKRLIKQYRFHEAKRLIENSEESDIKLIDVAYQSGFSNKVALYRAFKEFENVSPSEYLKNIKNGQNT